MSKLDGPARRTSWTDQLDGPVLFIWSLGQFAHSKIDLSVCTFSQLPSLTKALVRYQKTFITEQSWEIFQIAQFAKLLHNLRYFSLRDIFKIIQGVPKKRGISEYYGICFTACLIWNLENSFLILLKIEIHIFVPNAKPFLRDIRELRNNFSNIRFLCS